nr:type IV secretory system conjugative DNA transfer family protein [Nitrosomonas nitrosa]
MTSLVQNWWQQWQQRPQSLTHLCEQVDARYGIPRPAAAPHLPPYQAGVLFLSVCAEGVFILSAGVLSAWLWVQTAHLLLIRVEIELACHALSLLAILIACAEAAQLPLPYYHLHQRSTYGTARWADSLLLRDLQLARRKGEPLHSGELPLGGLGTNYDVVLNAAQTMCHLALFGPPGSGKSATFFMAWLRAWSATASAIVLDPKGELYEQTAYKFERVYRIDFQDSERSDRWNFLPACRHNAELAHEAAAIILNVDAGKPTTADPFWKEAETAALTAILLHLANWHERPTPAMIQELISIYSLPQLNEMMMASADPRVPLYWGMFTKVEPKLQGGVLIGIGVRCAAFNIPNAKAISSPITNPMATRGIRLIDFAELRQPRTAIYVVVPEGDAVRYKVVLATLFGLAASYLRRGEIKPDAVPVLFNFDEAGNIFVHGLSELLGVGRGRRLCVALGYQSIGQVYHHYGTDGGDAVLGSVGTMVFLPGLDHRTAEYASKRVGQATVWQSTSVDVQDGSKFDSERSTEVGRALLDASEVRRMVKHRQAIAIIGNALPVRFSYPPLARLANAPLSNRERLWHQPPCALSDRVTVVDATTTVAPAAKPEIILAATNRPTVSFGQIMKLKPTDFEPEYDPHQLEPSRDPSLDDSLER